MNLSELKVPDVIFPKNASEISISSLSSDSRQIQKDSMFAAIKGENFDGHDYIDQAIENGASNILVDTSYKGKNPFPLSRTKNVRKTLALMSAIYHSEQPDNIIAITGTNGKTSVCHFLNQIWELIGFKSAALGTLGLKCSSLDNPDKDFSDLTTLDPISLHKCLALLKQAKVNLLALEASSHGIEQHRLDGVKFSIACFTNLSHDHLDYHRDFDSYKSIKFKLFKSLIQDLGIAVINIDCRFGNELVEQLENRNLNIITYGENNNSDWVITNLNEKNQNKIFNLTVNEKTYTVPTGLKSNFQVYNSVAAAILASVSGVPVYNSILSIRNLFSPPGRMEEVLWDYGARVFIDFSHTPESLNIILQDKKPVNGKLILVVGCGGDRDKDKRKIIGETAEKFCDLVIVTDDNPRMENPKKIRKEILSGSLTKNKFIEIPDRKRAIEKAIKGCSAQDVVIIAGKGHEKYQIKNNKKIPHDDAEVAKSIINQVEK